MTWKTALYTGIMSFFTGTILGLYSMVNSPIKYLLTIGALVIGYFFFKKCETKGIRITFVLLSLFYAFLFVFLVTAVLFTNGSIANS